MSNFMIFDKETGQKIAEGMGLVLPSDQPNEMDYLNLREKMQVPELSFKVKISKRRRRKIRQMAIWKESRLPRKLKKAARHADFDKMVAHLARVHRLSQHEITQLLSTWTKSKEYRKMKINNKNLED